MPYIVYAKNLASNFNEFVEEFLSLLAKSGIHVYNYRSEGNTIYASIKYTDETGEMTITPIGNDIQISYTASGGPEVAKETIKGAALGGGISTVAGIIAGRKDIEQIKAGIAGAVAGGAYGAIRGYEKEMREKVMFAKLLARTVDRAQRNVERKIRMRKNEIERLRREIERLTQQKDRLLARYEELKGEIENININAESKRAEEEARHLSYIASIESANLTDKVRQRRIESENRRYNAALLRIEAWKKRSLARIKSEMARIERNITRIDQKISQYSAKLSSYQSSTPTTPPPPPPPP